MPSIRLRPLPAMLLLALAGGRAAATEVPPSDAQPLSRILEVTVHGSGVRAKLYVDPASGDIQRCRGRGCPAR